MILAIRNGFLLTFYFYYLFKDVAYIANIGDSRAIGLRGDSVASFSNDHSFLTNNQVPISSHFCLLTLKEVARVEKLGYKIEDGRIQGKLEVSRAFGDIYFKSMMNSQNNQWPVIATPEIEKVHLSDLRGFFLGDITPSCYSSLPYRSI